MGYEYHPQFVEGKADSVAANGAKSAKPYQTSQFFKTLLPTLPAENRQLLKEEIFSEGRCLKPLVVWTEQGLLLDGHHRDELIDELRAEGAEIASPEVVLKSFPSRWEAALWVIRHQTAQRPSWSKAQEAMAIMGNKELVAEIEAAAAKRKLAGVKAKGEAGRTVDILAKMTGIGRTTLHKVKKGAEADALAKTVLMLETAEATATEPAIKAMLGRGTVTFENLMSAKRASDRSEQTNKRAIEAKKLLPSFDPLPDAPVNQILYGDAVETLTSVPDDYVNLIFTSPPYPILGLKYGAYEYDGDYSKYLEWMEAVFTQCHRVLRKGGYLVVNFDNTYVQANERRFTIDRRRNVYADFDHLLGNVQL